jgi:hypothetical protein
MARATAFEWHAQRHSNGASFSFAENRSTLIACASFSFAENRSTLIACASFSFAENRSTLIACASFSFDKNRFSRITSQKSLSILNSTCFLLVVQ